MDQDISLNYFFLVRPKITAYQKNSGYEAECSNTMKYLIIIGVRCNQYLFILLEIPLWGQSLLFSDCEVRFIAKNQTPTLFYPCLLKRDSLKVFIIPLCFKLSV